MGIRAETVSRSSNLGPSSSSLDPRALGRELARELREALRSEPKALLLFAPFHGVNHGRLLQGVRAEFPHVPLIGGTTYGNIKGPELLEDEPVLLGLSGELSAAVGVGSRLASDAFGTGRDAAQTALVGLDGVPPKLCLLLHEPQMVDPARIHEGARSVLGDSFPIIGGGTGSGYFMEQIPVSVQFAEGKALAGTCVAMLLGGNFGLACGFSHGASLIGRPHRLTKVRNGNIMVEFDGRPALDAMAEAEGMSVQSGDGVLAAKMSYNTANISYGILYDGLREFTLRGFWGINDQERTLLCGTPIQEGLLCALATSNPEDILRKTRQAVSNAVGRLKSKPVRAAICFDCYGRKLQLGAHGLIGEELRLIHEAIGGAPMAGLYAGSEIGMLDAASANARSCYSHSSTSFALLSD